MWLTLIAVIAGILFSDTEYMHCNTHATTSIPYFSTSTYDNNKLTMFWELRIFKALSLASHRFHINVTERKM